MLQDRGDQRRYYEEAHCRAPQRQVRVGEAEAALQESSGNYEEGSESKQQVQRLGNREAQLEQEVSTTVEEGAGT